MKKYFLLIAVLVFVFLGAANSYAAFPIHSHQHAVVTNSNVTAKTNDVNQALAVHAQVITHKQSFFSHLFQKLVGGAAISKGLYIILAILPFGWLGMGLNDNFTGSDWIISLVLYILLWLPGLIYTLVKMKNYY
jgi:uncharacterized membrane protein YqaE (UPF0057 family)